MKLYAKLTGLKRIIARVYLGEPKHIRIPEYGWVTDMPLEVGKIVKKKDKYGDMFLEINLNEEHLFADKELLKLLDRELEPF